MLACLGKPPNSPYPPDLAEDAAAVTELEDLVDVVASDLDWANQRALGLWLVASNCTAVG